MGIFLLPIAFFAAWFISTFDTNVSSDILGYAWTIGTVIRVPAYYIAIEIYFTGRATTSKSTLLSECQSLEQTYLNLDHSNTDSDTLDNMASSIEYYREAVQKMDEMLNHQPRIWLIVLAFELVVQVTFFTVL